MVQAKYTIVNFRFCKTPEDFAVMVMQMLESAGIDCKKSDISMVEKPDYMPVLLPQRFHVTIAVPTKIGEEIDEVLKKKRIFKVNDDQDSEDLTELRPLMTYDDIFTQEVLRLGTHVVRDWMPTSRRSSIRNDGDAVSYESPSDPTKRVRILPNELLQDHRFQEVAVTVFGGRKARQCLKGY